MIVPLLAPATPQTFEHGPVEAGVEEEIAGLAEARPGLLWFLSRGGEALK